MGQFLRFFAILALTASLVACGNSGPGAGENPLLMRGNGGEPGSLDPQLAEDIHAFNIIADTHEGLLATDAAGELIPGVAEHWTRSDDGLRYTFRLRENARWSNGDAVTAADFVRAFDHVTGEGSVAPFGFLLQPVQAYEATGEHEFLVVLGKPTPYFLAVLTMPVAMPRHAVQDSSTGAPIGNGAYRVRAHARTMAAIELERNPYYWASDSVSIDAVRYLPIVDESAEYNQYRAGEVHITHSIPDTAVLEMQRLRPGETRISPQLALYYLAFDLTETPFVDVRVRKALTMAIDRERLVGILGRGEAPAFSIVPPGTSGHKSVSYEWSQWTPAERLAEARALLADAGYGPNTPLEFTYLYDAGGVHEKIALAVGSMWQADLPVAVDYEKREWQYFLDARDRRDEWQLMRFSWFGDYNDPDTFLQIFTSESSQNLARLRDAEYDDKLSAANAISSPGARRAALAAAEERLLGLYPVAPLYFLVSKHLVDPSVTGFEDNVLDRHPTRFLSLAPAEVRERPRAE